MATQPDLSKGEGLIRTYDLLNHLTADVTNSIDQLATNRQFPYFRRNLVRTVFSYIEGSIQVLKFELQSDLRSGRASIALNEKEMEILNEIRIVDEEKIPWNIPVDLNLKGTINLAKKLWNIKKQPIDFSGQDFWNFVKIKDARNRLTHPKTFYDIQISDEEILMATSAFEWIQKGVINTIKEKINAILETMPEEFARRFRAEQIKEYKAR